MSIALQKITDYLDAMAQKNPFQAAIIFPEGRDKEGRVAYTHVTYAQLQEETDALSMWFLEQNIVKGERCAVMIRPSIDFFLVTFSLLRIGAVPVFIDPGIGSHYLKKCLAAAAPTVFIGIAKAQIARMLFGWSKDTIKKVFTVGSRFGFGGICLHRYKKESSKRRPLPTSSAQDLAAILFTSGSTGEPKGVLYKHAHFMSQVDALRELYNIEPSERDLCTFPLFALFAPALGMTAIIPDMDFQRPKDVDPRKLVEAIDNFGVQNFFGSPALLRTFGQYLAKNPRTFPTLKRILSAGAPVPSEVLRLIKPCLTGKADIYTPYGATECLPVASMGASEILQETAKLSERGFGVCVGKPIKGIKVRIIQVSDSPISVMEPSLQVPKGTIGEITVCGKHATEQYYRRPESTQSAKIKDKETGLLWHRMGDLGYVDEKGRLWYCGRKTQRVKTKNGDLYTDAIEGIFNGHKAVLRTALVGVKEGDSEGAVLCVETRERADKEEKARIKRDLLTLAAKDPRTSAIDKVLFHKSFPVDIRHNSKIFREKLKDWATKELS